MHSTTHGTQTEKPKQANDDILSKNSFFGTFEAGLEDKNNVATKAEKIAEFHILKATNIDQFREEHDKDTKPDKKEFFERVNDEYISVYFSNED